MIHYYRTPSSTADGCEAIVCCIYAILVPFILVYVSKLSISLKKRKDMSSRIVLRQVAYKVLINSFFSRYGTPCLGPWPCALCRSVSLYFLALYSNFNLRSPSCVGPPYVQVRAKGSIVVPRIITPTVAFSLRCETTHMLQSYVTWPS